METERIYSAGIRKKQDLKAKTKNKGMNEWICCLKCVLCYKIYSFIHIVIYCVNIKIKTNCWWEEEREKEKGKTLDPNHMSLTLTFLYYKKRVNIENSPQKKINPATTTEQKYHGNHHKQRTFD